MSKIYEIAFELAGKINSSFPASFMSATQKIHDLDKNIKQLSNVKNSISQFENLEKAISDTERKFQEAQQEVNRLSQELEGMGSPTKALKSQLKSANAEVKRLADEIDRAEGPTNALELQFNDAKAEAKRLTAELRKTEQQTKALEREFNRAQAKTEQLESSLSEQNTELQELSNKLKDAGVSTKNLAQENARLAHQFDNVTSAREKAIKAQEKTNKIKSAISENDAAKDKYRGQLLDTVALAASLALPLKKAMDLESAMADVKKVVDFETPKQFAQMQQDIMKLTRNIPMTAEGFAAIAASGGQAGIARDELTKFASDAAKMGVAFDVTADEAGQTMAEWRSAFKMNQAEVLTLADKINYLGNTTAASAPKISEVVRRIGPLGEVGGVASGQIAALGATLVGMGVSEEIASTGIKNLILTMNAGTSATEDQQEVLESLGFSAEDMAKRMQTDAQGAIIDLLGAIRELPEASQAAALTELIGKESIGAIAPLLTGLDQLEGNLKKVGSAANYSGSMQKEFEARSATAANSLVLLKNGLMESAVAIGSILLPPLVEISREFATGATKVADFMQEHPGLAKALVYSSTAVIGLMVATTALGYGWALLKGAGLNVVSMVNTLTNAQMYQTIATKASAVATKAVTAAQWLWNAAMNANPIVRIITLGIGLAGVLITLYKNSETARKVMDALWDDMKYGAETSINFIIDRINDLIGMLNKIKIPDWVPLIGGKGVNIQQISKVDFNTSRDFAGTDSKALENEKLAARRRIGHNATGTPNWIGGLTQLNERGGEILNLPRGTQIIPHDVSLRMAQGLEKSLVLSEDVSGDRGKYEIHIHVHVDGGDKDIEQKVEKGIDVALPKVRSTIQEIIKQEARLAYE